MVLQTLSTHLWVQSCSGGVCAICPPKYVWAGLITKAECKCHDFLPSFLHRRPFGVQKRLPTNWRTKLAQRTFVDFLVFKTQKRTAKGHGTFFVLQKDAKKTPKGCRANFVLQLVATFFGRQKVAYAKRSANSHGTCIQPL